VFTLGCQQLAALTGNAGATPSAEPALSAKGSADPHAGPPDGQHDQTAGGDHGEKKHDSKGRSTEDAKAPAKSHDAHAPHGDGPGEFAVPFAWEQSKKEPLSRTRSYLRELLRDNALYMQQSEKFFAGFANNQTPRATIVTCSDSRVHTTAFDSTPENDDFMIRNIGNQVGNALGSVEYGIEHLRTPLLVVIGHTGCGAVKAAMGDISSLAKPIRDELEPLDIAPPAPKASERQAWLGGVLDNVHDQVTVALKHFGSHVQSGQLTVVGAVYDFRDDMGHGFGKIEIVNVNGNRDQERLSAFTQAVAGPALGADDNDPTHRLLRDIAKLNGRSIVDEESFEGSSKKRMARNESAETHEADAPAKSRKKAAADDHGSSH
jgi:carbonic anhydrase